MEPALKYALEQWYEAVNAGDLRRAAETVGDPVVVLGAARSRRITPEEFAGWVQRSGIRLTPRKWHKISLAVVEQDAQWPGDAAPIPGRRSSA